MQNYCANATLKANIGWYEKKDLYLKYYMNGQGSASLTIKAGIGNGWWNSMPIEVYSCDQPMGINWKTDRIRLPKNTQVGNVVDSGSSFVFRFYLLYRYVSLPKLIKERYQGSQLVTE